MFHISLNKKCVLLYIIFYTVNFLHRIYAQLFTKYFAKNENAGIFNESSSSKGNTILYDLYPEVITKDPLRNKKKWIRYKITNKKKYYIIIIIILFLKYMTLF